MTNPNPERAFLHDISNPISIAYGMVELTMDALKKNADQHTKEIERLEKTIKALERSVELIKLRKQAIIAASGGEPAKN